MIWVIKKICNILKRLTVKEIPTLLNQVEECPTTFIVEK